MGKEKQDTVLCPAFWRRRPDSNWGWRFCRPRPYHLATSPNAPVRRGPRGNGKAVFVGRGGRNLRIWSFRRRRKQNGASFFRRWSGQRGSNSLPPPWQGGALPDELCPHKEETFQPPFAGTPCYAVPWKRILPECPHSGRIFLVPPTGIEPVTRGFSVLCSTN